jgi:hypothetical protein
MYRLLLFWAIDIVDNATQVGIHKGHRAGVYYLHLDDSF